MATDGANQRPAADPLAGSITRIARARLHLDQLVVEVEAFLASRPYIENRERDEKHQRHVWTVHIRDAPPESLAFLASDFVHNARAALDNIVWALAPRQVQRRNPSFPLHEDPLRFQCEALPMLKGMKPGVIQAIEWCQPYHGDGHIRSAHRLLDLNRLWNFDNTEHCWWSAASLIWRPSSCSMTDLITRCFGSTWATS